MDSSLEKLCEELRGTIRDIGDDVRSLMDHSDFQNPERFHGQYGEMKANIMLSFRHLEDARMRLGKAMLQIQGGVSCFDKSTTPRGL